MCEFEREKLIYHMTKNDFGVHGSHHYRLRGTGPEVQLVFKQCPQLQPHHLVIMKNFTEQLLDSKELKLEPASELRSQGGHDAVMLVMQSGTWYGNNDVRHFQQQMKSALSAVLVLAEKHALQKQHITFVWAEQVTQHWPSYNGYFVTGKGKSISHAALCPPLSNRTDPADWRNDFVWESFLRDGTPWRQQMDALSPYVRVRVLNFRALTSDMNDFHMRQQKKDCTHYCYTPMMYQSIYHQLAQISADLATDVAAGSNKSMK